MKNTSKYICALILILFSFKKENLNAQENKIQSLLITIKNSNAESHSISLDDTIRIDALINLSKEYINQKDFSKSIKYANIARIISEKLVKAVDILLSKTWLANSLHQLAYIFEIQENYPNALLLYKKELVLRETIGENKSIAICLNKIGELYNVQDNLDAALDNFYKALKLADKANFQTEALIINNNIGVIFDRQKNYFKSLEHYNKALNISIAQNNKNMTGILYSNIGKVYVQEGERDLAVDYFYKFLKIAEETKNKKNTAIAFLNISKLYYVMGDFSKSFELQLKAMKVFEDLGNKSELALIKANVGSFYLSLVKTNKAEKEKNLQASKKYLEEALELYKKTGYLESIGQIYYDLSEVENLNGNFENSLQNYKMYIQCRDSLNKLRDNEKSIRAEINYEFSLKENIAKIDQERKEAVVKKDTEKQKDLLVLFIVAFTFMVVLVVVIFSSNRQKQKTNKIILSQKKEVEQQKILVEEKQTQMLSSINYAKRIQESILISKQEIKKHIPDIFISYIPKDIVSGDFYWYSKQGGESFIVVADCTGHGVPGAFLSMVGSTLLNEIINHKKISDPSQIIKELATALSSTLKNKEKDEYDQDGMDLSICKINHSTKKLYFAGTNQSIYIVNNKATHKIKAQVSSINGIFAVNNNEKITTIEWDLEPETMVYMSTDGYVDQIGEIIKKKFLTSRYEKLLSEIHNLPIKEQKQSIEKMFAEWKGNTIQIDDVLVIGFKI